MEYLPIGTCFVQFGDDLNVKNKMSKWGVASEHVL